MALGVLQVEGSRSMSRVEVVDEEIKEKDELKRCACCKKESGLKRCGKCKQVSYCSVDCQVR